MVSGYTRWRIICRPESQNSDAYILYTTYVTAVLNFQKPTGPDSRSRLIRTPLPSYLHIVRVFVCTHKVYYVLTSKIIMIIVQCVYPWTDGGEVRWRERKPRRCSRNPYQKRTRETAREIYANTAETRSRSTGNRIYIYNIHALCIQVPRRMFIYIYIRV